MLEPEAENMEALTFRYTGLLALAVALSHLAGCGGDTRDPVERHSNSLGQVDESDIRASIVGDDVEILVPLERLGEAGLDGRVLITLFEIGTGELEAVGAGVVEFAQNIDLADHRVVISGAGTGLERLDAATLVIGWRVGLTAGDLYGRRSLYAALGSLDVQLRGPTELAAGATSPLRVLVRDPDTSEAVVRAEVEAVLVVPSDGSEGSEPEIHDIFSGQTDAQGELLAQIALPPGVAGGTLRVTVTDGHAQIWTTHSLATHQDSQLYLSSDKTIYKPGQNIELRVLALEGPDRLPVADTEVTFEARDGESNKVFRRTSTTDSYGVASITVPTDTRVNEGTWRFRAEIDGRTTELNIPVERYNLPSMIVTVETDREYALPGDLVRGHVDAFYVFGEPVTGASITVDARISSGASLGFLAGTTDDRGRYDFEVTVPATLDTTQLEDRGDTLSFNAEVIDTASQTEVGTAALPLVAAPILINMLADLAAIVPGDESLVYLTVSDPLGRPLRAALDLVGIETDSERATGASGVAEIRFVPGLAAELSLEVTATDGAGRTHTRTFDLSPNTDSGVRVHADRAVYRAGDTARIQVFTNTPGRVFVDIYRGAEGALSTVLEVRGQSAELLVPVTEEMRGLLVIDALAVTREGTFRTSRPLLVDPEGRLSVNITADRETYAPGDEATVEVTITDADGTPRPSSIGLTVVNEAAFALGGEPTTSIRQLSGLDENVLPNSVNVFGRGAGDLLNTEDALEREQLARLLFAQAGEVAAPNFSYDALRDEVPRVVTSLDRKVNFDVNALLQDLQEIVTDMGILRPGASWLVQRNPIYDPFGQQYQVRVEDDGRLEVVATSFGPDETLGTADDITVRANMEWIFGGGRGFWGAEDDADGRAAGAAPDGFDEAGAAPPADPSAEGAGESGGTTVRSDFRETVYVNPTLITDENGRASITFPLADSITTWRVSADGSTRDGRIGAGQHHFRTFQSFFVDFNMPIRMTAGDTIEVPAVIYNYLDEATSVTVSLDDDSWYALESARTQTIRLEPSEVRAATFRLRVLEAGEHALLLRGSAGGVDDALLRIARVDPEGEPEDETVSGKLNGTTAHTFTFPSDTVAGGAFLDLVLTPGFAAEATQGVEAMLQEPNGCFEQTTSSAWPNTLVANYLEMTGQMTPELREQTMGMVTRGYQRLLTFESPTGGYNWWGDDDPGNRILSAIMLWHLSDLETLIEVDHDVRDRAVTWLVGQQNADGSWDSGDALHAGNEVLGTSQARTTGFIAWALAHTGWADESVERAAGWLSSNTPDEADLYANALVANALVMADPGGAATRTVLERLDTMRVDADDGALLWPTEAPSWTGASGDAASIETTGLVAYAFMQHDSHPGNIEGAMRFITSNKDAVGTWYNTQATMNALRALSAAASPRGSDAVGTVTVT
ncbi:MAG: hypothetical protein DRJ42_13925, partial [Deltaproteobacteria bacterium]